MLDPAANVAACWGLLAFQVLGLASACLIRMDHTALFRASCCWLFMGCLALMGLATMAATLVGPGVALLSGMTFCVMVISAVWDVGPQNA